MSTEGCSRSADQQVRKSAFPLEMVNAELAGTVFAGKLQHFTTIDSTQTRALADAVAGVDAGQVYLADEQTAGRGRGGHTWHSEPDRGVYLTALVRPDLQGEDALKLSLAAGLAVQSALRGVAGFDVDLRWPNDLVTRPGPQPARKLGGILAESALLPTGALKHAAIGIGINLNQANFPPELGGLATSVRQQTGAAVDRVAVVIALLQELAVQIALLEAEVHGATEQPAINERFLHASSWVWGKRVQVQEDESYTGSTEGLTPAGLLRVRCNDGTLRIVRHGGVRERFDPNP